MPGMIQWNNGNDYKLRIQFMEEDGRNNAVSCEGVCGGHEGTREKFK